KEIEAALAKGPRRGPKPADEEVALVKAEAASASRALPSKFRGPAGWLVLLLWDTGVRDLAGGRMGQPETLIRDSILQPKALIERSFQPKFRVWFQSHRIG